MNGYVLHTVAVLHIRRLNFAAFSTLGCEIANITFRLDDAIVVIMSRDPRIQQKDGMARLNLPKMTFKAI